VKFEHYKIFYISICSVCLRNESIQFFELGAVPNIQRSRDSFTYRAHAVVIDVS